MEQKKTERKWSLNLFDIIIILIAVAAAAGILWWKAGGVSGGADTAAGVSSTVTYTVELTNISEDLSDSFQVGDKLVDGVKKYDMGTVTAVEIRPYTVQNADVADQKYIDAEVPGKVTALLTVKSSCTISGGTIKTASGFTVRIGASVSVKGPGYMGTGTLVAIEREDG